MRSLFRCATLACLAVTLTACGPTVRRSGQIELFTVERGSCGGGVLTSPRRTFTDSAVTLDQARIGPNARVDPRLGDLVRFTTDTVTITVPAIYLDHLPATLSSITTGRYDAMLFAEVWENAAMDRSEPALNRVVYVALDQPVPGRLNFQDAIAYGPTAFKGQSLRIKFTLVLLQKRQKESGDTAARSLQDFISLAGAGTPAGASASTIVALIRQIIRSLPDVEAFDFEATFHPFRPTSADESKQIAAKAVIGPIFAAAKQDPTNLETAHLLGDGLKIHVASQRQTEINALAIDTQEVVRLSSAKPDEAIAKLDSLVTRYGLLGLGETVQEARAEINKQNASGKAVQALPDAAARALIVRQQSEFQNVMKAAEALKAAQSEVQVRAALDLAESCADFNRLKADLHATSAIVGELNARPWFRYGMYALVETAHYRAAGTAPHRFSVKGTKFKDDRFDFTQESTGTSVQPNWMLMDVLPGLQAADDRVLRATSDAADRFLQAAGHTPGRRLIENPAVLETHLGSMRDNMLDSIITVRAERIAIDLARDAKKGERHLPFSKNMAFDNAFKQDLQSLASTNPGFNPTDARWTSIGERVRSLFETRFKPDSEH